MRISTSKLVKMKQDGQKIVMLTAYDYPFAKLAEEAGVHIVLVGDSLGNVVQGRDTTLPVTMEEMIYHTQMVCRGTQKVMVMADMPFLSYQTGISDAIYNAGRILKETDANSVKLEGGVAVKETIKAISQAGIPVMAHIGLTPQYVHQMGGFKVQRDEERLLNDALEVQDAGAFALLLEGIPAAIAQKITESVSIPTIGIGAGKYCDGQVLVLHDMLGINTGHIAKFVKQYANLAQTARDGISAYVKEVSEGSFPDDSHSY